MVLVLPAGCTDELVSRQQAEAAQELPCNYKDKLDLEEEFKDQPGRIYAIKDIGVRSQTVYVIKSDYYRDVLPCKLPVDYQQDGLQIVFSGRAYQVPKPNVDILGLPFELVQIRKAQP